MKILEVSNTGRVGIGHMGPVTNVVYSLVNTFADLGEDVTLLDAKNSRNRTLNREVSLVQLNVPGYPKHRQWPALKKFVKEAGRLELSDFDIIHVHDGRLADLFQKYHGVKCVYTIHSLIWYNKFYYTGLKGNLRWLRKYLKILIGIHQINSISRAGMSIALGEFVKQAITTDNIIVIRNGIDLEKWPLINRDHARIELKYRKSDFVLVFAASIRPVKGLNVLINAVRLAAPQIPGLRVLIMGHYSEEMLSGARGLPMEFTGFISNRSYKFRKYLAAADALIVPSLFDNQPTVVLEGLSMGLPVIGSRVGGIPDMVSDDVGLLFEPGNSKELAKLIRFLYSNPDIRTRMNEAARSRIENYFSWETCAENYLRAFDSLLARTQQELPVLQT